MSASPRASRKARAFVAGLFETSRPHLPPGASPLERLAIPAELRAWRESRPHAIVRVHRGGVELHALEGVRKFGSVAEAIKAIGGAP